MPPLKCATELFPANLFDLDEREFPWWVAHTRSRQDKALGRHLLGLSVPHFLPQREKRYRRGGRTFVSYLPLFPGYVFFRGTEPQRHDALRSNLIVRTLPVQEQHVLTQELLQLRRLQQSGASLVPYPDLSSGDPVRVVEGPFKGYTGVVVREAGRLRLIVSVSMLKSAVAVEFERQVLVLAAPSVRSDSRSAVASGY
ncbi:MAG: transcription termination/antitermination NusG family protein [Acidobacteriota bacterium]